MLSQPEKVCKRYNYKLRNAKGGENIPCWRKVLRPNKQVFEINDSGYYYYPVPARQLPVYNQLID